jgi:hypothetical protein
MVVTASLVITVVATSLVIDDRHGFTHPSPGRQGQRDRHEFMAPSRLPVTKAAHPNRKPLSLYR